MGMKQWRIRESFDKMTGRKKTQVTLNNATLRKLYNESLFKNKVLTSEVKRLKDEVRAGDEREYKLVLGILQKGKSRIKRLPSP